MQYNFFPFICPKVVNIYRISAGIRVKLFMFWSLISLLQKTMPVFFTGYITTVRAEPGIFWYFYF